VRWGEQAGRLGQVARAILASVVGGAPEPETPAGESPDRDRPARNRDRFHAPLFLLVWYGGMLVGYFMGPARSHPVRRPTGATDAGKD